MLHRLPRQPGGGGGGGGEGGGCLAAGGGRGAGGELEEEVKDFSKLHHYLSPLSCEWCAAPGGGEECSGGQGDGKKVRVRELQAEEAGGEGCGEEGELEGQVQRSGEEVGKGGLRRAFGKLLAV